MEMSANPPSDKKEYDVYRDSLLRYLGYANEVGESFRRQIGSKWVAATYGVATCYVLADAQDKARKTYKEYKGHPRHIVKTVYSATDVIIWQMLASVAIPGFTINRICYATAEILKKTTKLPKSQMNMIITAAGLTAIPFIIHPIDYCVDKLLDNTIRKIAP